MNFCFSSVELISAVQQMGEKLNNFNIQRHPVVFGSMTNSRESKCLYFTQTYIRFCKASQRKLRTMLWYKESLMVLYCITGWFEAGYRVGVGRSGFAKCYVTVSSDSP